MRKFRLNKITQTCQLALIGCGVMLQSGVVNAQESDVENTDIETIEVQGYRVSEQKARDIKREATGVVDAIIAEDIGKMPDENIAEALQRMTGISISRDQGEGSTISVRGIEPDLNRISINGKTLTSTGDAQGVGLEAFSAGLLERVEVFKTQSASMVEGSLGGGVNLKTRRALDQKSTKFVVAGSGVYSDRADIWDPKVSINYIDQSESRKFGIATSLTYEKRNLRQDGYLNEGYFLPTDTSNGKIVKSNQLNTDASLGPLFSLPEDSPHRILNGEDYGAFGVARPKNFKFNLTQSERERIGGSLSLEYRPDEETEVVFDATYSRFNVTAENHKLGTNLINLEPTTMVVNENNTVVAAGSYLLQNGEVKRNSQGKFSSTGSWSEQQNDTYVVGLDFNKQFSDFKFESSVGYSRAERQTPLSYRFAYQNNNRDEDFLLYGFNMTKGDVVSIEQVGEGDPLAADAFKLNAITSSSDITVDDELSATMDFDIYTGWDFFHTIETGIRFAERTKNRVSDQPRFNANTAAENGDTNINFDVTLDVAGKTFPVDDFLEGASGNTIHNWPIPDIDKSFAGIGITPEELQVSDLSDPDPARSYDIYEAAAAAYIQANFNSENDTLAGNIGVRFINTETESSGSIQKVIDGETTYQATTWNNNYDNVLPSLNIRYNLAEDFIARFGVGRAMSRPSMGNLAPRLNVSYVNDTVRSGNPNLKPLIADYGDLTLEYYMGKKGMVAAGVFYKEINNYTQKSIVDDILVYGNVCDNEGISDANPADTFRDPNDLSNEVSEDFAGALGCNLFQINRPVNGASATVEGAEFTFFRDLDFMPGALKNLSVKFNYTFNDSTTEVINPDTGEALEGSTFTLPGLSKHTYNSTLSYETKGFNVRLSHNYRTRNIERVFGPNQNVVYVDPYGQLDLSAGFSLTDNIKVSLQVVNVTDEIKTKFLDNRPYWEQVNSTERVHDWKADGRRVRIGINGVF